MRTQLCQRNSSQGGSFLCSFYRAFFSRHRHHHARSGTLYLLVISLHTYKIRAPHFALKTSSFRFILSGMLTYTYIFTNILIPSSSFSWLLFSATKQFIVRAFSRLTLLSSFNLYQKSPGRTSHQKRERNSEFMLGFSKTGLERFEPSSNMRGGLRMLGSRPWIGTRLFGA